MSSAVVVGGGLGGLAAAGLLGRAGVKVTLLEAAPYLGGKSRRLTLAGQRIDTGPEFLTFLGIWEEYLRRWDGSADEGRAADIAALDLVRLPKLGTYHYRGDVCSLPVEEDHPWHAPWRRYVELHADFGPDVTLLLSSDWKDPRIRPVLRRIAGLAKLTAKGYLQSLSWLPEGLKEVIAIHALDGGAGPRNTPALYAAMPAVIATEGAWVPEGGLYELVLALGRLAEAAGAELRTEEPVERVEEGRVFAGGSVYEADFVVSDLDANRLEALLPSGRASVPKKLTPSGVDVYAALREPLPPEVPNRSVLLPDDTERFFANLESGVEPEQTVVFLNHYRPEEIYPNERGTLTLQLAVPASGKSYELQGPLVQREMRRVEEALALPDSLEGYLEDYLVLDPAYFAGRGSVGGAIYGVAHPFWQIGPLHRPRYSDRKRPWLWRVGASVHPGGGVPAVLSGAMISTGRLLEKLGS
ncbi:MAG: NAD(P)/FAD-dependent oxidoreductase [Actinomycetota bacterium]|nr:NAD(P)/FAD-dependent oxidoreductase [Actinomycetota bacterium]